MTGSPIVNRLLSTVVVLLWIPASVGVFAVTTPGRAAAASPIRDSRHQFRRRVCSWQQLRQRNIVMQRRDYSCGAAALATLIRYYWGDPVTEDYILKELDKILTPEEVKDRIEKGLSITDLRRVAVRAGYQAKLGKLPFQKLTESKIPLVVGIIVDDYEHFVVYRGWDGQWVYLADPIRGNIRVHSCEFPRQWQKHAILVVAKPGEKVKEYSPLSVRASETSLGATSWQYVRSRGVKFPQGLQPGPPLP